MKNTTFRIIAVIMFLTAVLFVPGIVTDVYAATQASTAGIVNTTSGSLNVRTSESSSTAVLTALPKGSYVTLLGKSGSWWKVEYASGAYGYVLASYIECISGTSTASTSVSSGYLNVRTGAGSSYPIAAQLSAGKTVVVLSMSNGWSKILYNGTKVGYASSLYLRMLMAWPVPASTKINQYFSSSHNGIDIAPSVHGIEGDKVTAAYSGTVVYAGTLSGYGYVVYINSVYNGKYIQTRYGHLKSMPLVNAGDTVNTGQTIGYMGNTGDSTGVHLHFEVRIRSTSAESLANAASTAVNPLSYLAIN